MPSLQSARPAAPAPAPSRAASPGGADLQPRGNAAAQEAMRGGLPPELLDQMESSFGADFGDVSVHEDGQAGAIGALAYARGEDLHFAPGRFDPDSAQGRELIGHELAHVVQQRAGRVEDAPLQAKGLPVQADDALESEADAMGKIAADGGQARIPGGGGEGGSPDVAQCAFGLEMELNNFYVKPEEGKELPAKRDPLVTTPHGLIELQAENAGPDRNVEFVTKPGGLEGSDEVDTALLDFAGVMRGMQQTPEWGELPTEGLGTDNPGNRTLLGQPISPSAGKNDPEAEQWYRNAPKRPNLPMGSIQATVGMPLDRVEALFEAYAKVADRDTRSLVGAMKDTAETDTSGLSPDFRGLLTLVNHIVHAGESSAKEEFPKACVHILNRTDFSSMLKLLPDAEERSLDDLAVALLKCVKANPNRRVFNQTFKIKDKEEAPYRIPLTIGEWLLGLPEGDLLQEPAIESADEERKPLGTKKTNFGGLNDKTDDVDGKDAPVLELRTPKGPNFAKTGRDNTGDWLDRAYDLYDLHESVLGHKAPDKKTDAILDKVYGPDGRRVEHDEDDDQGSTSGKKEKCIIC